MDLQKNDENQSDQILQNEVKTCSMVREIIELKMEIKKLSEYNKNMMNIKYLEEIKKDNVQHS